MRENAHQEVALDDRTIIESILSGASLRTFMIPDSSIPSNYPEHIETYDLPHIIINGDYFWAKSETTHLSHSWGSANHGAVSFAYTNIGNMFCSYNPATGKVNLMSKSRYRKHVWHIKEDYVVAWDSGTGAGAGTIGSHIESCAKFRIALLDDEDIWNIHPVDLPMYFHDGNIFNLKTKADFYPFFFRSPAETKNIIRENGQFFSSKPDDNTSISANVQAFPAFYAAHSDGTYYNYFDIERKTVQRYKRLIVYVEVPRSADCPDGRTNRNADQ